jgi:transketolase
MRRTCLDQVHALARRDERVVFIGSDLGPGTLDAFKSEFPDRFFMEGVSEQAVIGMAAGMAMEGYVPYVNTIATFLTRRCFEQVAVDVCLHNLPVRLIGSGGGLVYAPLGPTHLATEDMAIMRALPNMTVVAPADADEMTRFMATTLDWPGPIYIRLAKGGDPIISRDADGFRIGKAITLREVPEGGVALIAIGVMVNRALKAAETLAGEGIGVGVLNVHTLKPLDSDTILTQARQARAVFTLEEHTVTGGLGSAVAETLIEGLEGAHPIVRRLGIPDAFPAAYGSQDSLMETYGLQPEQIFETVLATVRKG